MKTIKQEIEGRGGSFNGFTSEEHTCYLVKMLAKDAELGIDILSDMVLNPRLDAEEIRKEKSVIVEEINMYKDIPSHYVHEILAEMMWPDQPLGMPLAGTAESVKSITRDAIVAYKEAFKKPLIRKDRDRGCAVCLVSHCYLGRIKIAAYYTLRRRSLLYLRYEVYVMRPGYALLKRTPYRHIFGLTNELFERLEPLGLIYNTPLLFYYPGEYHPFVTSTNLLSL
jgi:Predicted Zn-dependent peptidases